MFKEALERIVSECSGGIGAILMGFDGIAIDSFSIEDAQADMSLVGIEYSNVTKEILRAAEILGIGDLTEVSVKTDKYYIILHVVTDEYFLALLVDRQGNFGKGRYLLMREVPRLKRELE